MSKTRLLITTTLFQDTPGRHHDILRGLIHEDDVAAALHSGYLAGYGADVVEPEPIVTTNPLLTAPNVVLTPHVGSRTYESVERQAVMAVENMLRVLNGQPPHAQANMLS